jgi:cytochrome c-type biogenesis protein CcmI
MLWIVCAVAVVVAGGFVLAPLFRSAPGAEAGGETERDRLLERKTACYRNLKELEFQFRMGRLLEADYEELRAEHRAEAARILEELERLGASGGARCPGCGARCPPGKKFCADCGKRL